VAHLSGKHGISCDHVVDINAGHIISLVVSSSPDLYPPRIYLPQRLKSVVTLSRPMERFVKELCYFIVNINLSFLANILIFLLVILTRSYTFLHI
jgi:hypothetical protein